ncbi:MAG: molybdopterin-binding protein, partial [Candidatus Bathyarchaeia archaeon]
MELERPSFELLSIGNELLIGRTLNTNGWWLARQITLLGGFCIRMTVIRDDLEEISNIFREILHRSPRFIIASGGLGPTYDDVTLEGLSKALSISLRLHRDVLSWISQRYEELYRRGLTKDPKLTPQREKMAMLPLGSKPLRNPVGVAPGILLETGRTKIVCLPGVPEELKAIFEDSIKEEIIRDIGCLHFVESKFTVLDLGESSIAPIIEEAVKKFSPIVYIKTHPRDRSSNITVEFHVTSQGKDRGLIEDRVNEAVKYLKENVVKLG